jgi:hypothetical protein
MLRKFFSDKDGRIVILQRPNVPLWIWMAMMVIGMLTKSTLHTVVSTVGTLAILVWAVLEISWGASPFRRTLGGLVMLTVIWRLAMFLIR